MEFIPELVKKSTDVKNDFTFSASSAHIHNLIFITILL